MIEHLVLFKLKADADAAAITVAFLGLKAAIPAIHEISFGAHRTSRRSDSTTILGSQASSLHYHATVFSCNSSSAMVLFLIVVV